MALNSVPLDDSVAVIFNQSSTSVVIGQTGGAVRFGDTWVGILVNTDLDVHRMYKLQSPTTETLTITGVVPINVTYSLNTGWTWIGIPLANGPVSMTTFLPGTWVFNDKILTQGGAAQYFGDVVGWQGSLTVLTPGKGYKVFKVTGGTFTHST